MSHCRYASRAARILLFAAYLVVACNGERLEPAPSDVLLLDGPTDAPGDVGVDASDESPDLDVPDAVDDLDAGQDSAPDGGVDTDSVDDATSDTDAADAGPVVPAHRVIVTEVMADNDEALVLEDGESPDWIELHNPGPEPVSLVGFTLSDDVEDTGAPFSNAVLLPGEFLVVRADGETLPFRLSADGEEVVLRDSTGALVDHFDFGPMPEDVSAGRGQATSSEVLVDDGHEARFHPGTPGRWRDPDVDDRDWSTVRLPIGYDLGRFASDELALFQDTSQSSDGYGFTGVQAVDGDRGTISHTGDADLTPWWQVKLANTAELSDVILYNRVDCCRERLYNLVVEILDEGGLPVWSSDILNPTAEGSWPVDPGESVEVPIEPPTLGRFVRVTKTAVNGAWSTEWLSLGEVVVSGSVLGPYEAALQTVLGRCTEADGETIGRFYEVTGGGLWGQSGGRSLLLSRHIIASELWERSAVLEELEAALAGFPITTGAGPRLAALAADWPTYDDPLDDVFPDYVGPLLMLQGGLDPATQVEESEVMAEAYQGPAQTWAMFPDAGMPPGHIPHGGHCPCQSERLRVGRAILRPSESGDVRRARAAPSPCRGGVYRRRERHRMGSGIGGTECTDGYRQ